MDNLIFGISGLPIGEGNTKFTYSSAITYLKQFGLDAMELPFVRSVNVTDKNKNDILSRSLSENFYLSAHGSYYINLNAEETEKKQQSLERIIKGAEALKKVNGKSLVFHPGFYLKSTKEATFAAIVESLQTLPDLGIEYRLETTGKPTQFGTLQENVAVCKQVKTCKLCIDFSHLHARENGSLKSYDDFARILHFVGEELGSFALEDMHIHLSGIHYGEKGEKNHLSFEESDFNYRSCLKAFKDFNIKGCVVCESPLLERDAFMLKKYYLNL